MKPGVVDGEDPELLKSGGSLDPSQRAPDWVPVAMELILPPEILNVNAGGDIFFDRRKKKPALGGLYFVTRIRRRGL